MISKPSNNLTNIPYCSTSTGCYRYSISGAGGCLRAWRSDYHARNVLRIWRNVFCLQKPSRERLLIHRLQLPPMPALGNKCQVRDGCGHLVMKPRDYIYTSKTRMPIFGHKYHLLLVTQSPHKQALISGTSMKHARLRGWRSKFQ